MGCDETREDIEEKMLYTHLKRDDIRRQRKLLLEELKLSTGKEYKVEKIPDYVDIEYIRKKKQKHYEKLVKEEVQRVEEKKRKEEKEREELEKEMEEERKNEQLIYMPLDLKVTNNYQPDLEDVYYLNYVLEKKQNKDKKDKNKDKNKEKKDKIKKKDKKKKKNKHKKESSESEEESEDKEEK